MLLELLWFELFKLNSIVLVEVRVGLELRFLMYFLLLIGCEWLLLPCEAIDFSLTAFNIAFDTLPQFMEAFRRDSAVATGLMFSFILPCHS